MPETYWRLWSRARCWIIISPCRTFQHSLGVVVFHLSLIAQNLVISRFKQLLAAVAQLGSDRLLHSRVRQFALARGFLGNQFHNAEAD